MGVRRWLCYGIIIALHWGLFRVRGGDGGVVVSPADLAGRDQEIRQDVMGVVVELAQSGKGLDGGCHR